MSKNTPETIVIRTEPIELSQLLKFAGIFSSGGEAKFAINGGQVTVDGAVEKQARKKILGGQTVVIGESTLLVKLGTGAAAGAVARPKPAKKKANPASAGGKPKATVKAPAYQAAAAGKPSARPTVAKPSFAKPAPKRRDADEEQEQEYNTRKPVSEAAQRTFFYTELLKAKQGKRTKR